MILKECFVEVGFLSHLDPEAINHILLFLANYKAGISDGCCEFSESVIKATQRDWLTCQMQTDKDWEYQLSSFY